MVFKHGLLAPYHLVARLLLLLAGVAPAELVVDQHAVGQRRLGEGTIINHHHTQLTF